MESMKKVRAGILLLLVITMFGGCGKKQTLPQSDCILSGKYEVAKMPNMTIQFFQDGRAKVLQRGVYRLEKTKDRNLVRICFDDISQELPEDYTYTEYEAVKKRNAVLLQLYWNDTVQEDKNMLLVFEQGEDGLLKGEAFDGSYHIGSKREGYHYQFQQDGQVMIHIELSYYTKDDWLTLVDASGETRYRYELQEEEIIMKSERGDVIMTLQKIESE